MFLFVSMWDCSVPRWRWYRNVRWNVRYVSISLLNHRKKQALNFSCRCRTDGIWLNDSKGELSGGIGGVLLKLMRLVISYRIDLQVLSHS